MLHPSYHELMNIINATAQPGEGQIVNSRYSVVIATAKRARQLIDGDERLVPGIQKKPLSIAVDEIASGKVTIVMDEPGEEGQGEESLENEDAMEGMEGAEPALEGADSVKGMEPALEGMETAEEKETM